MEVSKKTRNAQEKNKMVIKIGGCGGGGIGSVVLLGGVLVATAALASAFMVRRKGRSSGEDHSQRHQKPPSEKNRQSGKSETNKGQGLIFPDQPSHAYEHPSKEARKEVESDNDSAFLASAESLSLDQKARVEIDGGTPGDVEILCSIRPKKLEKDAVSDHGFVAVGKDFPLEPQNKMPEAETTKEDVSNDNSNTIKNLEQVYIEEESGGSENEVNERNNMELNMEKGKICEEICIEAIERGKMGLSDGMGSNQEAIYADSFPSEINVSQSHNEDGQTTLPPVDNPAVEIDIVDDHDKEKPLKIVQEGEFTEGDQEDGVRCIEEKLVKEKDKCDQRDEGIIPENSEKENEDNCFMLCVKKEENSCMIHPTLENVLPMLQLPNSFVTKEDGANEDVVECLEMYENKSLMQFDVGKDIKKEDEDGLIPPEDIEMDTGDGANEEVPQGLILKENDEAAERAEETEDKSLVQSVVDLPKEHEEDSSETINGDTTIVKNGRVMKMSDDKEKGSDEISGFSDESVSSDEVGESSVGSGDSSSESNWEAIWPAEPPEPQQVKLINHEMGGKIHEDKTVKDGEPDSQIIGKRSSSESYKKKAAENNYEKSIENFALEADKPDSEKTFLKKYFIIGMLSLLSSLSCSWFFGLSFVKFSLIVLLTIVLSEINGY